MIVHNTPHELAGKKVRLKDGAEFVIEDWADRVYGHSIWMANGNPAALEYAVHRAANHLPIDEQTVYGKVGFFGYIRHISEIDCEIE